MKNVCIIRHGYYPHDMRVRKEARALVEKGFGVDVICLKRVDTEKSRDEDGGVGIYRFPVRHVRAGIARYLYEYLSFFLFSTFKVTQLHIRNRYDYIQVNTLPDFLVFVAAIPKVLGAKVIIDLHEPTPELWGTIFGSDKKIFMRLIQFFEQMSIRFADRAITVTEQMKRTYVKRGAPPSKISVILNVPNPEFKPDGAGEQAAGKNGRFILMCHGTIVKRYGQHVLIKAIDLLKDQIPSIQLHIMGSGEHEQELKKLVASLGLNDYVLFIGFVPIDEVIRNIKNSDIGVVPVEKNPYSDLVHTNKMFEYIAMKKPVIITRTKAVEEYFGPNGDCLKYFESGNEQDLARCVAELYHDAETRGRMAENALKKIESIRWENVKDDYCSLFGRGAAVQ